MSTIRRLTSQLWHSIFRYFGEHLWSMSPIQCKRNNAWSRDSIKVHKDCIKTFMSFVTPSPNPKDKIKPLHSKVTSSHQSHTTVSSALMAFKLASNVASHALFLPKRRFHRSPTNIEPHPPLKRRLIVLTSFRLFLLQLERHLISSWNYTLLSFLGVCLPHMHNC